MKQLFDNLSNKVAVSTTKSYSTSFSMGIRLLSESIRQPIYNIYGFVRLSDEIVDSFHGYGRETLFSEFKKEVDLAIERKISTNPILNAFQETYHKYEIDKALVDQFLKSMEMDLHKQTYDREQYNEYILGSAQVVGLMCLKVFVNGDPNRYEELKDYAMSLGSAFQKINFLRDLKDDYEVLGRAYFPELNFSEFNLETKVQIEEEISKEFEHALIGIRQLPGSSRFGVYLAYIFYIKLFNKIKHTPASRVMKERIRIPNETKMALLFESYFKHNLGLI